MTEDLGEVTAAQAAERALDHVERLTRRQPLGVTSVAPTEEGWLAEVEVVEESRVPSTANILGLYEVDMEVNGDLVSYRRTRRYARGRTEG
ncbi:gas vesicle protein GvpO [Saccharomonospora piscinae]|uniref:Gas vesicle protein GvpO n=1 Tax=Saccharomonospora piscinae TaxID=687388 RepID=A0A1V9A952_SACPI|nr:gas vesicle protein GvpO [Saccharomonospora piscinae]OQO93667.1 gas vesicle protein GvpO [Saccharomonospora piscinae]TLW94827.1 gas vesicle protein [Saccharomonospora piscinae]